MAEAPETSNSYISFKTDQDSHSICKEHLDLLAKKQYRNNKSEGRGAFRKNSKEAPVPLRRSSMAALRKLSKDNGVSTRKSSNEESTAIRNKSNVAITGFRERRPSQPVQSRVHSYAGKWKRHVHADDTYSSRTRSMSVPFLYHNDPDDDNDSTYCLKQFSITKRGEVINYGDLKVDKLSRSTSHLSISRKHPSLEEDSDSEDHTPIKHTVAVVGASGTGKTLLIRELISSENAYTYESSTGEDYNGGINVNVCLDDFESELTFHEYHSLGEFEDFIESFQPKAFIILYTITELQTLQFAEEYLAKLADVGNESACILVANQSDLARKRVVSSREGQALATRFEVKWIETSCALKHNVDELLVGILKQIRLKQQQQGLSEENSTRKSSRKSAFMAAYAKGMFLRLLSKKKDKDKHCKNLHVL